MGISTHLTLPATVRVRDFADVIGIAAGLRIISYPIPDSETFLWVEGITVSGYKEVPSMASIDLHGEMVDGEYHHWTSFHFEGRGGTRIVVGPSTPFWIACFTKACELFGGTLDYNDCDSNDTDLVCRGKRGISWDTEDDEPWWRKEKAIAAIEPLTTRDLIVTQEHAEYIVPLPVDDISVKV